MPKLSRFVCDGSAIRLCKCATNSVSGTGTVPVELRGDEQYAHGHERCDADGDVLPVGSVHEIMAQHHDGGDGRHIHQ